MTSSITRVLRAFLLSVCLGGSAVATRAADAPDAETTGPRLRLVVKAKEFMARSDDEPEARPHLFLDVLVVNDGPEPVTLPTVPDTRSLSHREGHPLEASLEWGSSTPSIDGHPLISPASVFQFVTLRPNEAFLLDTVSRKNQSLLSWIEENAAERKARGTPRPDAPIQLKYSVRKEFAERYGCWSGTLKSEGDLLMLKDGRVVADDREDESTPGNSSPVP